MIRQDDPVVGLVVHDAVEPAAARTLICLDHGQRLEIEHRDGAVVPFVVNPWPVFGAIPTPWTPGRLGMSPTTLPVRPVHDHHVRGARHEHAAGRGFDGHIISAAVSFDVELVDFERLQAGGDSRDARNCEYRYEDRTCSWHTSQDSFGSHDSRARI